MPANSKPSEADDVTLLRRTFDVARRAQTRGNHPFAALLVSAKGDVLIEMENGFMPDHDMTGHAERLLATQACKTYDPQTLARATIYSPTRQRASSRRGNSERGFCDTAGGAVPCGF